MTWHMVSIDRQGAHTQPSPEEKKFNTKVPLGNSQDRTRIRTLDHRFIALSAIIG